MTAIAYRDGVMAADSLVCGGGFRRGYTQKIARSPRGTLGGCSGHAGPSRLFRQMVSDGRVDEWIASGMRQALNIGAEKNEFGGIIVTAEERVICVDFSGRAVEMDAPFYVEGSAELILIGALAAGATAEEAVRIAIQFDDACGGDLQVERISSGTAAPVPIP